MTKSLTMFAVIVFLSQGCAMHGQSTGDAQHPVEQSCAQREFDFCDSVYRGDDFNKVDCLRMRLMRCD